MAATGGPGTYVGTGNVFTGTGSYVLEGDGLLGIVGAAGAEVENSAIADITIGLNLGIGGISALTTATVKADSGSTANILTLIGTIGTTTLVAAGGTISLGPTLSALSTTNVSIFAGGTFIAGGSLIAALTSTHVTFGGGGGATLLGTSGTFLSIAAGSLFTGFLNSSDHIDDRSLSFSGTNGAFANYVISGPANNQTVTINDNNGKTFSFNTSDTSLTDGTYASATAGPLLLTADGSGGTDVSYCFLTGTLIHVPEGKISVEELRIGDPILTADGRVVPVRWIGTKAVASRFCDLLHSMPIRVRAGALADSVPERDLFLSPDHALFIDGILVQAGALVNGVSISREAKMPETFTYYHIEVGDHSLILAEGTPVETFVDNVDRMGFDNWTEYLELFGDDNPIPEMAYPRAKSARQVPRNLKALISARQTKMGEVIGVAA